MKIIYRIIFSLAFCILYSMNVSASTTLSITGLVKKPVNLSVEDIERFQTVRVQFNEVMKDGTYKGAFSYRGVTLRSLLDTVVIEKKVKTFSKHIDMAIKVKNREGEEVVISWGEIYYRNSNDIIIATSATPIMPHNNCASCHDASFYKPYTEQLSRDIELPKLAVGSDGKAIEDGGKFILIPSDDLMADRDVKSVEKIQVISLR